MPVASVVSVTSVLSRVNPVADAVSGWLKATQATFPRADFQAICRTGEPDQSTPFALPAGPYDSAGGR